MELVVIGVAVLASFAVAWTQARAFGAGGLGIAFLLQFVYPLTGALLTAAIVSLLLRRVLRRHRAELSAEIGRLHSELAAVRAAGPGDAAPR